ncbi:MAG: DUF4136 domain-containing protein [Bacteroidia bacterium]|nr:DUF4136 domain-containing protein [Bacteroidia bacterium]NND10569.1 DUF4136 domain-containing protein [Flavobacteriaceae bacterium]NNK26984.1 DUF4136 domain-containing protein [Flavobacteriaceae bacterium]NNL60520.1 DUF4136 domain-containing protein [Flavobacteriaceae bacterium]RZV69665.1 MAG: DUF4136 domain-containing protein [Flavobacteriaceae bacterium]
MKKRITLLISILVISCAPIYVNYDYETGTDFNQYKTYNMFSEMQTGLSELDTNRLLDAIDQTLQDQGFSVSDSPDFYVNVQSSEFRNNTQSTVGVGIGGTGRNVGGGVSVGIPVGQSSISRELIFDLIDAKKDLLIWQAVSESSFNPNATPENRTERLKAIVAKVFSKFPPEK